MFVRVDPELCDASGKCAKLCPDIFRLDEYGYAAADEDTPVPTQLERAVRQAQSACPTAAISVER